VSTVGLTVCSPAHDTVPVGAPNTHRKGWKMFEVGDVLSKGWEDFKGNAVNLILVLLAGMGVIIGVNIVVNILSAVVRDSQMLVMVVALIGGVAGLIVNTLIQLGWLSVYLKVVRGKEFSVGDVFSQSDKLVPAIIASLLIGLGVIVGMILLVVPGIIIALMTSMTLYFIVDQNMGAMDAIKASIAATQGKKLQLFVFGLAAVGVSLLGALACGVGMLATIPLVSCAFARVYLAVSQSGGAQSAAA
jgi:uncharacterized membrane protein